MPHGDCNSCGSCESKLVSEAIVNNEFKYDYSIHSLPTNAVINLTNDCNLKCPYCFVHQNPQYMTYETAKQCCEFVLANKQKRNPEEEVRSGKRPGIVFFGGEPLMQKDLIMRIVSEYQEQIEFSITTNGALLDEDFILFCYRYSVAMMISFDGARITQERQRPSRGEGSSFDEVMQNIHYYIMMNPNSLMRATVTKESIPEIYSNYLFAKEQGFASVTFILDEVTQTYSAEDLAIYEEQMSLVAIDMVDDFLNERRTTIVLCLKDFFQRINEAIYADETNAGVQRCGYGTTSCGVSPMGEIVHCQEKSSCIEGISLGNVWDGIDAQQHEQFLKQMTAKMDAMSCPGNCPPRVKHFCKGSLCPVHIEDRGFTIPADICQFVKTNYKIARRLFDLLSDTQFNPLIGVRSGELQCCQK